MITTRRCILLILLAVFPALMALAGAGTRIGTAGASELLIPVGTRDIGMGGATVATSCGVEALFWNPASSALMTNSVSLYVSHMSYIADIGVDYGAVSAKLESIGTLSLSVKSLSMSEIPVTTTTDPDGTGQTFQPQFFTVGFSYARALSERIAVGATANLISERLGDVNATGVGFSIGVVYEHLAAIEGLSLGVVVKNIGPQMCFSGSGLLQLATVDGQNRGPQYYAIQAASFELPSSFEFGIGYKMAFAGDNSVLASGGYQSNNFSDDEYKMGLEYAYQDLVFIRVGYDASRNQAADESIFGAAFGFGVHTAVGNTDISFDYAYRAVRIFDNNHVFSLTLGF